MAIQELLMESLTHEDLGTAVVTLPPDLDGQGEVVTVPRGVDLQMFNCKNFDLIHEGDGVLGMYGCDINKLHTKDGTHIDLLDCRFNIEVLLEGTTGYIEGTDIDKKDPGEGCLFRLSKWPLYILEGSDIELKLVNFSTPMQIAILAEDSGVTIQQCRNLTEFTRGISCVNSKLKMSRSQFFSTMQCLELIDTSFSITSSSITGYKNFGVVAVGSTGRFADCSPSHQADGFIPDDSQPNALTKGIRGAGAVVRLSGGSVVQAKDTSLMGPPKGLHGKLHDWGIKADNGSVAEFVSSKGTDVIHGGFFPAIECNGNGSSVSVIGYKNVSCQDKACLTASDGGKIALFDTDEVFAYTQEAINVSSGASVEIYRANKIQGKTWGAIITGGGKLLVEGPTSQLEGEGDDGIIASNKAQITIKNVTLVDGAKCGIKTTGDCDVSLVDVIGVEGKGEEGINLSGGRLLAKVQNASSDSESYIQGQTSGVLLDQNARSLIFNYDRVEGTANNAVGASNGSHVTLRDINNVLGLQSAVTLSTDSRVDARRIATMHGSTFYGVHGDSGCSARLQTIDEILGGQGGVILVDGADYLEISGVNHIQGVNGHGVWFQGSSSSSSAPSAEGLDLKPGFAFETWSQGSSVAIDSVPLIEALAGVSHGIFLERCNGTIKNITKIWGKEHGLVVHTSSVVTAEKISLCYGDHGPHGLDVAASAFTGRKINFVRDGSADLSRVHLESCTFGGAFVSGESALTFAKCMVNGHFEITNVSYDLLDCKFFGEHISLDSSGVSRNYLQAGDYGAIREGAVHTNFTCSATLTVTESDIVIEQGSVAGKATIDSSSLEAKNTEFSGGVDGPSSSIELHNCNVAAVTLNTSSLLVSGGVTASIEAQSSGIIGSGANLGAITVTGSSANLYGVTASGVQATGSGIVGVGGSLGTVNLASSSAHLYSTSATVTGVSAKASIPCRAGAVVQAGTAQCYNAFDQEARGWYSMDYQIYAHKEAVFKSQLLAYTMAPVIANNYGSPTDPSAP